MTSGSRREIAAAARAWPFEEARKIVARIEQRQKAGRPGHNPTAWLASGPVG